MTATAQPGVDLVLRLHAAAKTAAAYGPTHNATHSACEALSAALRSIGPACRVHLVAGCAFVDKQIATIHHRDHPKVSQLVEAAGRLGAHEIEFVAPPPASELRTLVTALGEALSNPSGVLEDAVLKTIRVRELHGITLGDEGEMIDRELFAIAQLSLALHAAERTAAHLYEDQTWPWTLGLTVVRHLERALETDATATLRALEMAPVTWDASRSAVSASRGILHAAGALGLPTTLRRAVGHAAFGVALLAVHGHASAPDAARTFAASAKRGLREGEELSAHRLRVLAAASALHGDTLNEIGHAIEQVVELELVRAHSPYPPTRVELLAHGLAHGNDGWMRVLVQCEGALPPGSRVVLADGRLGIVVGMGDGVAPWRPTVLVGADLVQPTEDVELAVIR